jgi:hypothetical protein
LIATIQTGGGMNFKILFFLIMVIAGGSACAQENNPTRIHSYLDLTLAFGDQEGTAAFSYIRNWRLGKAGRLELGLGLRWTSYAGNKREFYTAPARLARSSTVPFVGVFSGHEYQNVDTLTVQRPLTNSLNLSINGGYRFGKKWRAGANIDLIGFTFGNTSSAILVSNRNSLSEPDAGPASFNLLLTGDLDYGALNSEFFVEYSITPRWHIKAVYQFFFTEYNTKAIHQTAPDGTIVYRFRNKANLFGAGVSYDL